MAGQVETAGALVNNAFDSLFAYAGDAFSEAQQVIGSLGADFEAIDTDAQALEPVEVDQSFDIDPMIEGVRDSIEESLGDFDLEADPGEAPVTDEHAMPDEVEIEWPEVPELSDIEIPEFADETVREPGVALPNFNLEVPALESTITSAMTEAVKVPTLNDLALANSAQAKLKTNIDSGGTMLDPAVETDIWERDLERHEQQLQDSLDKLTAQWAKLGFSLPDGLLAGQMLAINNEYMNKSLDRSREIAVKQAELEQQGMFKSLELATGFSGMWFGVLESYKKRAFDVTNLTVNALIGIYKERVNQFNIQLEAFKADLLAWKTGIEREMLRAEVFKARIGAEQLKVNIDDSKVKMYISHMEAIGKQVQIWETQIKAVALMYGVEKTKLDTYKVKVEAYSSRVDSATKKYVASMEGVKSLVSGWAASADAKVKLIALKTETEKYMKGDLKIKQWEIELRIKEQEIALRLETLKATASAASNLAAGALSALQATATASFGFSESQSYQHQYLE